MNKIALGIAVIALALAGFSFLGGTSSSATLGGVTNFDALTLSTGPLVVTTTNTATSSMTVGCINSYATSTATAIKLIPGAANASASSTFSGGTSAGFVIWQYGSCP